MIHGCTVFVRWRTPVPGSGYDLWDGERWIPITQVEFKSYVGRGVSVHVNPSRGALSA